MKRNFGFTLIELMVVVGVVAILTALAVPTYGNWIRKANRGDAQSLLLSWANNQEIWRASHTSYAAAGDIAVPTHDRYNFTVVAGTNTYTLTATATTAGNQDEDQERGTSCTPMTINQIGTKTPAVCWQE